MIDESLIARIYTVDQNDNDRVGTGYPVTPDLLLTALHVVDYPELKAGSEIEVVWNECGFKKSLLPLDSVIYRGGDGQFDIALIRCPTPLKRHLYPATHNPSHNSDFRCRGYPLAGQHKNKPQHDALRFSGNTEGTHQDLWLELTAKNDIVRSGDSLDLVGWSGLSGSAVIVDEKLVGVISTKYKTVEKRLFAVSLPYVLKHCEQFAAYFPQAASFEEQIIAQIAKALSGKGMEVYGKTLREELNEVLSGMQLPEANTEAKDIAKGLVQALQQGGKDCLVINQAFSGTMFRCFDPQDPNSVSGEVEANLKAIEKGIETILGYLVLSLVNPDDARQLTSWLGTDDLSAYYFELHVRTLGGVELFVSHHQRRKANIDLDETGRSISGKHIIFHSVSPFQWSDEAKLQETQLAVWNAVNHEDRSTKLTPDEVEELEATLNQRRVRHRDQEHYCLVLEFEDKSDTTYTKQCASFLGKLKIPMVRYQVPGGAKAFHGQEQSLMTAVADFLKNFNECIHS